MPTLAEIDAEIARRQQPQQAPVQQAQQQGPTLSEIDAEIARRQQGSDIPTSQEPQAQPMQQPQESPADFSVSEMVGNIPSSAVKLGKDIVEPFLSPIETVKSIGALGSGALFKANEALSEAMPEALDFMSEPIFGDGEVLGETQAPVAEAVGDFINERYGSVDAFKSTVQKDPVGVLADVSALFTGGASLIPKTGKMGKVAGAVEAVGKAVDPLNTSVSAVKTLAKSGKIIPEGLPQKLLESAVKFRPGVDTAQRANMIKTSLKHSIMPTVGGLDKISTKLNALDSSLNKIIDKATTKGIEIPKGYVFSELKKLRQDIGGVKIDAKADLRVINKVAKDFNEQLKSLGKNKLTPRELQDFKTNAYSKIKFDLKQGKAGFAKNETRASVARQAKVALEGIDPNIKVINKEMGDLLELKGELGSVVNKLDNRNLISLDTAAKIAAGAGSGTAVGSPVVGSALGVAAAVAGNPRVKAQTAIILENIRKNAGTIEIINNSANPVLARALSTQAGRINESLNAQLEDEGVE
jgi:hypothetical protein